MKLLRLATLYLMPPPEGFDSWQMSIGSVLVQTHPIGKQDPVPNRKRLLVHAETHLGEFPGMDSSGRLLVPEMPRMECESAIEVAASLLSVMCMCKRSISSPNPWIAFSPETDVELNRLQSTRGIQLKPLTRLGANFTIGQNVSILSGLSDRFNGVVLLAESFAHESELGRYREFMRFFEWAFALPATQLGKKLSQFLGGAGLGYSREEIESWLRLRHEAIHGDGKKSMRLLIEADVRPLIQRMKQATYDVLFNKQDWNDPSRVRRELWHPPASTLGLMPNLSVIQGSQVGLEFHFLDGFGVYPFDLSASLDSLPDGWWAKRAMDQDIPAPAPASGDAGEEDARTVPLPNPSKP